MNLNRKLDPHFMSSQESNNGYSDAIERAEALLERIEKRLKERTQTSSKFTGQSANSALSALQIERNFDPDKLDS